MLADKRDTDKREMGQLQGTEWGSIDDFTTKNTERTKEEDDR
jgi:hypothetical protein